MNRRSCALTSSTKTARLQRQLGHADAVPETQRFADDGRIPNSRLPVLIHRAPSPCSGEPAALFEALFAAYPPNQQDRDPCRVDVAEHDAARARIAVVSTPESDSVTGP